MGSHGSRIPRVPWNSRGNRNKISHGIGNGMGMGTKCMEMGIKTWEWENIATKMLRLDDFADLYDPHEMGRSRAE